MESSVKTNAWSSPTKKLKISRKNGPIAAASERSKAPILTCAVMI